MNRRGRDILASLAFLGKVYKYYSIRGMIKEIINGVVDHGKETL